MVTHIQHLEDFAVSAGAKTLRQFVADIHEGRFEATIKYDGAPAIVFGKQDHKKFIATKSYFNKTPKLFYSAEEIVAGTKDPALADKLCKAFDAIHQSAIPEGHIYQGDLMFWNVEDSIEFQPNIVRYYLGGAGGLEVGIAVHTQLAGDPGANFRTGFWSADISFESYPINIPPFAPEILDITQPVLDMQEALGADILSRVTNYHIRKYNQLGLSFAGALVYGLERSIDGKLTREQLKEFEDAIDAPGMTAWNMIEKTFTQFEAWKINIYHELNLHAQQICNAVIDKRFYHEGFVLKTPTATVKIVLRDVFSVANFDPNAERGWTLTK